MVVIVRQAFHPVAVAERGLEANENRLENLSYEKGKTAFPVKNAVSSTYTKEL